MKIVVVGIVVELLKASPVTWPSGLGFEKVELRKPERLKFS